MDFRRRVELVAAGRFACAGVAPPMLPAGERAAIVWQALASHGVRWDDCPRSLCRAEGFRVWRSPTAPYRCGCSAGRDLLVPRYADARELGAIVHHERAHGWLHARGEGEAGEADAILLGLEFVAPRALVRLAELADPLTALAERQRHAPLWMLALAVERIVAAANGPQYVASPRAAMPSRNLMRL